MRPPAVPKDSSGREGEQPSRNEILSMDTLSSIPTLYAQLLDELESATSQLPINPYQSQLKLLLKSFNPRFQWRLWRSDFVRRSVSKPDAFQQELPFAAQFLQKIEHLAPGQIEALRQCNAINVQRLSKRVLVNQVNKLMVGVSGLFGIVIALKQAFGIELLTLLPDLLRGMLMGFAWGAVLGLLLNLLLGYLLLSHKIKLLRAFDDLLSVARAFAILRKEPPERSAT